MAGEAASDDHVGPCGGGIEQVLEFGQQVLEVAVDGENEPSCGRGITIPQSPAHAAGRRPDDGLDPGVRCGEILDDPARTVAAVVVHKDNFTEVWVVIGAQRVDQAFQIGFLVVAGNNDGNGALQRLVRRQGRLPLFDRARLLGMDDDPASKSPDQRQVFRDDREVLERAPGAPGSRARRQSR